jgi:uncharacterized membrane protein
VGRAKTIEYGRCALLGAATGMRSMVAPAMLSRTGSGPRTVSVMLQAAAAGEMVADKLPGIPSRLEPQPLLARLVIGAFAGGIAARRSRGSGAAGALVGAAGALTGALIGYQARRLLTHEAGLPDPPVALVEDMVAIALAHRALRPGD